ncbi:MAG: hypothetical protein IJX98_04720 [Clostridia bacterium]|nr:hypothetical protein [Clostridia bacterium]
MITFHDWIYSVYPAGGAVQGAWSAFHIITLIVCIGICVAIAFLIRPRSEKCRKTAIRIISGLILFFELARRIINFTRGDTMDFQLFMSRLIPRPWCAISCWLLIFAPLVNKKFFYNFTAMSALLTSVIFFAYPVVGFNNKYILFENVYSIATHCLQLIGALALITLKFTDFKYHNGGVKDSAIKELICLAAVYLYSVIEILIFGAQEDPLYYVPNGEVQTVLGMSYPVYLVCYILFIVVWFNAFYVITYLINKKKQGSK